MQLGLLVQVTLLINLNLIKLINQRFNHYQCNICNLVSIGGTYYKELFRITTRDSPEKYATATGVYERQNLTKDLNSQDTSQAYLVDLS